MGKPNVVTKRYMKDNARFADVCNFYLYDGKEIIRPEDLSDAEYLSGFAKDDKLVPVVTLTIFWNYGVWDGARSLHEMFDVQDKAILDYVSDYKLNLIIPEEIENFDKFKTELGPVLEFISSVGNGNKLEKAIQEKGEHWTNLSNEAIDLLNICLDAKLEVGNTKEGVGNVCKGIEELKEMCIARGKAEGKAEGILSTLLQLVRDGLLSLSVGAQRAGMSEDDFNALLSKQ